MVWIICTLVLTKPDFINNYLLLLISNIVLVSNIFKTILSKILYRNQLKQNSNMCNVYSSFVA